ncbi:MAG: VCBS repeat-containing protein [Verrucomicrobiota bacterium]
MPRYIWPKINAKMVDFMQAASLPINGTEMEAINSYYEANSPENLALIPDVFGETGLNFRKMSVGQTSFAERPQITSVKIYDVDGDGYENDALVTDNNLGAVTWLKNREGKWSESTIAKIPSPVNTTPFDFEGDGDLDFAISAMGYMHPNDELIGELHLLINDGDGKFKQRVLVKEVPRITDCAPGDFDGDGDMDFVVAMFGWRETGRVCLLRQEANGEFVQESIYEINGCMRVLPNDADGDGDLDFVALVTQQHETIAQFVNDGTGAFETKVIARAAHPAFGSSSIFLHDLDEDGDEDILYTNGDMMDEHPEPKPYHGVRWLENDGKGVYELHHLASMPGCYDAKPADMDGDGDLDLVISALYFQWDQHDFPSLAWLENLGGFRDFTPRRIAFAPTNLANIAVGDIDQNGKPDILAGGMHVPGPLERKGRITVWLQE